MHQFLKDVHFRFCSCFVQAKSFPDVILQPLGKVFRTFDPIVEVITFGTLLPSTKGHYTKNEAINEWKS
jgi:hypothetical protein